MTDVSPVDAAPLDSAAADAAATDSGAPAPVPEPTESRTRVFAIANQKGGVGKTTTAVNLATAMAACDLEVLVIDLDPQGNASTGFGIDRAGRAASTYEVLIDGTGLAETVSATAIPGLSLVPSKVDLSGAELELIDVPRREFRMADALAAFLGGTPGEAGAAPGPDKVYDYVLIDCPPALGLLTLNALCAADAVLVPLQCEFYALEGLSHLVRTIERVRRAFNPRLDIQGVVLTMFDRRNNLSNMVADDVREHFGDKVYETVIPRNVRVSEAPSHGKPVLLYDMHCAGSQAYIHLASEILKRERRRVPA